MNRTHVFPPYARVANGAEEVPDGVSPCPHLTLFWVSSGDVDPR